MALRCSANKSAYALNIWIPATAGLDLRVGNVVTKAWAFATDIACCCHDGTPYSDLDSDSLVLNGQGQRVSRGASLTPIHAWHELAEPSNRRESLRGKP